MKTTKFILAFFAIALCSDLLFAVKPLTGNPSDFAKSMLKQISKDINLTDSQKVKIETKAYEFGMKILNKDSVTYQVFLPQYKQEYKTAVDSILTRDQRELLIRKRLDRKNAVKVNKHNAQ